MSQTAKTQDTPDSVATQLRDLERQGGAMARLAHVAAGLLLAAFSAGSLVSISHAAFVAFLAALGAHQADIPDAISLAVNLLLVLAADVALLYAASVLRVLVAAQAPASERRVHVWAMVGASLLEASTYLYLAWQFDRPSDLFLWVIVLARAIGAPLFAAYLSMARPLPVAPRDVAYQASLAAGRGVVRDVATLAADPGAPLERKARIYTASALMTAQDRTRFDGIIDAVAVTAPEAAGIAQGVQTAHNASAPFEASQRPHTAPYAANLAALPTVPDTLDGPETPPDGPDSPSHAPAVASKPRAGNVTPLRRGLGKPPRQTRRQANRANARSGRRGTAEARVRAILAQSPGVEFDELVKRAKVSPSTASKYRRVWLSEGGAGDALAQ